MHEFAYSSSFIHLISIVKNFELRDYFFPNESAESIISSKYDLIANICHDSFPVTQNVSIGSSSIINQQNLERANNVGVSDPIAHGIYRIHVQNKATLQWYEIQDLHVAETIPQLVGLSESCMLIYELKQASASS
jgi:U4/U6.U5 tri-snRNP-associated protein 2